jgi:hypothetical protein
MNESGNALHISSRAFDAMRAILPLGLLKINEDLLKSNEFY